MTAADYIHTTVPGRPPTEKEVDDVLCWCRDWAADTFPSSQIPSSDVALLRGCNNHIEGGLVFVVSDVRRLAN